MKESLKVIMMTETIAGISTAPGSGGIGIVRLSGDEALEIAGRVFEGKSGGNLKDKKSHTIHYGHIIDPKNQRILDEVLLMLMKGPNTYTREDVIEINCHGGMVVIQKVLELLLCEGARMAEPGEFTKRAFLNGRIDLSQAEAVIDIINSKTDLALKTSVDQLEGSLAKKIKALRQGLIEVIADIEAAIDYPEYNEEHLTREKITEATHDTQKEIKSLLRTADTGRIIKEGIETVIVGKPNVGKSSLMNALLKEQRAIVTDIPGTTRDTLEEFINVAGVPLRVVDTAGIRETEDVVEQIGVKRSKEAVDHSDLAIFVLDLSRELSEEDEAIVDILQGKKAIVVFNKNDLEIKLDQDKIKAALPQAHFVSISAKEELGLDLIESLLKEMFLLGDIDVNENTYITNVRHKDALVKAIESLEEVKMSLEAGMPEDCYSIDLKNCYESLGEISGDSVNDSIIDQIFSQFCLGK